MDFDIAFGLIIAAVGAAILICALAHSSPSSLALVRFASWPSKNQDRTDLVLRGWFYIAFGALLAIAATDLTPALLLIPVAVLLATGIALGVRHRGV